MDTQNYDIQADPGQKTDIATQHPEVVQRLRDDYEAWWKSLEGEMKQIVRYGLGGDENPMTLSSHDWLMEPGERDAVWHQNQIARGDIGNGPWAVDIACAGTYEITLHRWAPYLEKPMGMIEARLRIGDSLHTQAISEEATGATFRLDLEPGPTMLKTWLKRPGPERIEHGAYYLHVRYLEPEQPQEP